MVRSSGSNRLLAPREDLARCPKTSSPSHARGPAIWLRASLQTRWSSSCCLGSSRWRSRSSVASPLWLITRWISHSWALLKRVFAQPERANACRTGRGRSSAATPTCPVRDGFLSTSATPDSLVSVAWVKPAAAASSPPFAPSMCSRQACVRNRVCLAWQRLLPCFRGFARATAPGLRCIVLCSWPAQCVQLFKANAADRGVPGMRACPEAVGLSSRVPLRACAAASLAPGGHSWPCDSLCAC